MVPAAFRRAVAFLFAITTFSQTAGTGSISGTVLNAVTNRLRNPLLREWIAKQATDVKIEAGGTAPQSISLPLIPRDAIEKAFREAMEKQP